MASSLLPLGRRASHLALPALTSLCRLGFARHAHSHPPSYKYNLACWRRMASSSFSLGHNASHSTRTRLTSIYALDLPSFSFSFYHRTITTSISSTSPPRFPLCPQDKLAIDSLEAPPLTCPRDTGTTSANSRHNPISTSNSRLNLGSPFSNPRLPTTIPPQAQSPPPHGALDGKSPGRVPSHSSRQPPPENPSETFETLQRKDAGV